METITKNSLCTATNEEPPANIPYSRKFYPGKLIGPDKRAKSWYCWNSFLYKKEKGIMEKLLSLISLVTVFIACNNDANKNSMSATDSANQGAHAGGETTGGTSTPATNYMKAMHDAMDNSMQQMHEMKPTGDPDYDFAMMMKLHHQGAIDMSQSEIAGGTDEQLKQMAQKMIDDQQKENAQFDKFMQGKSPTGNSDYGQRAMGMMTPMSNIQMESGSLDAMFASMMIPHHQDAVKMAQEYLKVGKNAEMKKIAQNIVVNQPKEIQELQNWLTVKK